MRNYASGYSYLGICADHLDFDAIEKALGVKGTNCIKQNKAKCDKAVLKAQYLANKEVASALVAAIPAPAAKPEPPAQQILTKGAAKAPQRDDVVAELNKLPAGKARVEFVKAHAAELAAAAKI